MRKALLVGRDHALMWALPQMLKRAGFSVDVIASSPLMQASSIIEDFLLVPQDSSCLPALYKKIKGHYDWIVVTEDGTLAEILHSDLSLEDKLKILPVETPQDFRHLYSKIGLSEVFADHGILTPPFRVARTCEEALIGALQLSYPILIKRDASGGGSGIFECLAPSDVEEIPPEVFQDPVLVQKKIGGIEFDLSALYLGGELIHFNCAKVEKVCGNRFGPSFLRTYFPLSEVAEEVFEELRRVGKALGAKGFTNIGCMLFEGRRFYFEVDMRPNAWVEIPRYLEEDPANRIRDWFGRGKTLCYPVVSPQAVSKKLLIPYFLRLKRYEFLFNRYHVWRFIPRDDPKLILRILRSYLFRFQFKRWIKKIIPKKYHPFFKRIIVTGRAHQRALLHK